MQYILLLILLYILLIPIILYQLKLLYVMRFINFSVELALVGIDSLPLFSFKIGISF